MIDSKADDVIATPGDKGSADQNAGATSVKTEEVKQQSVTNSITPQASGDTVTIHFNQGFTNNATHALGASVSPDVNYGDPNDPIFKMSGTTGSFFHFGKDTITRLLAAS